MSAAPEKVEAKPDPGTRDFRSHRCFEWKEVLREWLGVLEASVKDAMKHLWFGDPDEL